MLPVGIKKRFALFIAALFFFQLLATSAHYISHHLNLGGQKKSFFHGSYGSDETDTLDDDGNCPICNSFLLFQNLITGSKVATQIVAFEKIEVHTNTSVYFIFFSERPRVRDPPEKVS